MCGAASTDDKPDEEGEPFCVDVVCELIAKCAEQPEGFEIVQPPADTD